MGSGGEETEMEVKRKVDDGGRALIKEDSSWANIRVRVRDTATGSWPS